jgi:hypothetical protein
MSYKQQVYNQGWYEALTAVREKMADGLVGAQSGLEDAMSPEDSLAFRIQVHVYRAVLKRIDELDDPPIVDGRTPPHRTSGVSR